MNDQNIPIAVVATQVAPRTKPSIYPEPFASQMQGREKRPLGDLFGISNFGVNLTRLLPNARSALRHAHSKQDEFIYILQGQPVLITNEGEMQLTAGMCAGFKAGTGNGHHLLNRTQARQCAPHERFWDSCHQNRFAPQRISYAPARPAFASTTHNCCSVKPAANGSTALRDKILASSANANIAKFP